MDLHLAVAIFACVLIVFAVGYTLGYEACRAKHKRLGFDKFDHDGDGRPGGSKRRSF